jgi:HlyD family secretion protein
MKNRILFILSIVGLLGALAAAYFAGVERKSQPPVFSPAPNPYEKGVYAQGIIESHQSSGQNINIYPEVAGTVAAIPVAEGQVVRQGSPLVVIDSSIQKATAEQQKAQAEAALALLQELKAQPRKETLEISTAQLELARANLKTAQDQLEKQTRSFELNPKSVSKNDLDNAKNAVEVAKANVTLAQRQYELTKAGAWSFDIRNQQMQHEALEKAYAASSALLAKYTIRAPVDGVVMSVNTSVGSYTSPQGAYDSYTGSFGPLLVMGSADGTLAVRVYVDEILVHRLPAASEIRARMFIRGTSVSIPLEYVRVQPFVSPKIELSNQRQERVDVRVLPVIFRFEQPKDLKLYPGQLVDVYIAEK